MEWSWRPQVQQLLNFAGGQHERMKTWGVVIIPHPKDIYEDTNKPGIFKNHEMPQGYYLVVAINQNKGSGFPLYQPSNGKWVPEWCIVGCRGPYMLSRARPIPSASPRMRVFKHSHHPIHRFSSLLSTDSPAQVPLHV